MRTYLALMALLALSACGKPTYDVPPEFQDYVTRFQSAAVAAGNPQPTLNIKIQFGSLADQNGNGEQGNCETGFDKTPTITIDKMVWANDSDILKEELMFHELGHCVLNRKHDDSSIPDVTTADGFQMPKTIMNSYMVSTETYSLNKAYYQNELFNP